MLVGSDGLDLRMTWPERQLEVRRDEYRHGQFRLADTELPFLADFIKRCGGRMPPTFDALEDTEFDKNLTAFWQQAVTNRQVKPDVGQLMLNASARYAYAVEWWEYEGRRGYLLDPITAHALLHTNIEDFPAAALRLPVRSFFIRIPRDIGWEVSLYDRPEVNLSVPLAEHPEPVQPLDGIHVTASGENGQLTALQVIISGRSARGPMADHCIWGELNLTHHQTLGEVIDQRMEAMDRWAAISGDLDRKVVRMALGAILYITSSHPELRPIEPPSPRTLSKALRAEEPARRARAAERSRYTITYVGGPNAGFHSEQASTGSVKAFTRKPPRPHVRAGHMRHVWVGARESAERHTEIRWIQPVSVGSWDRVAAYNSEKGYTIALAKTRPAMQVNS